MKCFAFTPVVLLLPLILSAQYAVTEMRSGGTLHPLQANMDIRHYTISLSVDPSTESISGYGESTLILEKKSDTILFHLAPFYQITGITVDNKRSEYVLRGDQLFIFGKNGFTAGAHIARINYHGKPPLAPKPPWEGGFTWSKDHSGKPWVVINCQMQGGKVYFPCKDHPSDEPDEGADLYISVPTGLKVAGPGMLASVKRNGTNMETWHWKTRYPISNYCLLFNVGNYRVYRRPYATISGNTVPMEYYVLEQDTAEAKTVMDIRERDTRILEKYLGEYPWVKEKIGIVEVNNPGMEHQTMISFDSLFEYDTVNGQLYSANLYHEFGHEWFANKVTNKDWAHMWIQEGINTYAESFFFLETGGERSYDSIIRVFRSRIRNQTPVVPAEVADTRQVYDGDIYFKGGFFMHTLRYIMGDDKFFPALKKLATDSQYTYNNFVETNDVEKLFSSMAGKSLKPLFIFYLYGTDKLQVTVKNASQDSWEISSPNTPMDLPLDVQTDSGIVKITLSSSPVVVRSAVKPVVDPRGWYLR